jgi:8-oxo-dGTP pyrophosphatase MutT (NUDIX family)
MADYGIITGFVLKKGTFKNLEKIQQVYGIILNEDNCILIVLHKRNEYLLPGGKLEPKETLIECLKRECLEEANITLMEESIKEAFYQEVWNKDVLVCHQVRYTARIDKDLGFISDPDESIIGSKWVSIDDLDQYLNWGDSLDYIKSSARLASQN